jgi:hypothetical protein
MLLIGYEYDFDNERISGWRSTRDANWTLPNLSPLKEFKKRIKLSKVTGKTTSTWTKEEIFSLLGQFKDPKELADDSLVNQLIKEYERLNLQGQVVEFEPVNIIEARLSYYRRLDLKRFFLRTIYFKDTDGKWHNENEAKSGEKYAKAMKSILAEKINSNSPSFIQSDPLHRVNVDHK